MCINLGKFWYNDQIDCFKLFYDLFIVDTPWKSSEVANQMTLSKIRKAYKLSHLMKKHALCQCENKCVDQLCGNCAADQHLRFRYTDSTISLLPKAEI